jgi:hypothetical protein
VSNIILDALPETSNGLRINSDFRVSILFELLMQDNQINEKDKLELALDLYYVEEIKDVNTAFANIIYFYACGKKHKESQDAEQHKQIYSFEYDAEYIFSAFLSQYNLDLNSIKYLHWWKFKALFNSLNEDHLFSKIMGYRLMELSKIKDKEQRKYYRDLKIKYRLPDQRNKRDKEREFANALG